MIYKIFGVFDRIKTCQKLAMLKTPEFFTEHYFQRSLYAGGKSYSSFSLTPQPSGRPGCGDGPLTSSRNTSVFLLPSTSVLKLDSCSSSTFLLSLFACLYVFYLSTSRFNNLYSKCTFLWKAGQPRSVTGQPRSMTGRHAHLSEI
jgi:hypothetical protein